MSHYELLEEVGRGGMGVVYKALDTSLGRNVALKILRKDHSENAELISQLETEAAITASINHPYVVRVFSTGTFEGRFYIAMELVDKGTLDDLITLQGSVAEAQVLEVAIQIAQGLRAAYQHGLIHRDVKPGNILFSDAHTAKIVDFGLATIEQAGQASGGEIWGTPYYVAPEKLDQKPEDFRSDMYSLGATLFHALAGRPPFEAADATLVALKHLKSEAVSLQAFAPHVSGSTAYVINRTLSKDPDKRYLSYDEFIEHLEYARREFKEQGSKPKAKQRMVLETERDQKLWSYVTFGMLGLVLLGGGGAWWFSQKNSRSASNGAAPGGLEQATPQSASKRAYEDARALLVKGDFAGAAKQFQVIAADPKVPSPLRHWAYVHKGLAHLFAGDLIDSRESFEALRELGAPTGEGASLAKFFSSLADKARSPGAVKASEVRDFDRATTGPLAMLVLGMKNWELTDFDEAAALIRQFNSAQPSGTFAWIAEYKPLVTTRVADLTEYRGAMEMVKAATTSNAANAAREALTRTRAALHDKGKLASKVDSVLAELPQGSTSAQQSETRSGADDAGKLDSALNKAIEQAAKWQFATAREELSTLALTAPVQIARRDLLITKLGWLEDAKGTLIAASSAGGRSTGLTRKDGSALGGAITKATQDGLESSGGGKIGWQDVAPSGLIAVLGAANAPDAQWSAGVLAAWAGEKAAARKHLVNAARGSREYIDALSAVWPGLKLKGENLALRKTAMATHSTSPENSPEKGVDGNPATSWSSDRVGTKLLHIDLGTSQVITRWGVRHARYSGGAAEATTAAYSLEASTDGKAWRAIDVVKGNVADATNRNILPTQAQFFRVSVQEPSARNTSPVATIAEFELYGGMIDEKGAAPYLSADATPIFPSFDTLGIDLANPQQLGESSINPTTGEWNMKIASRDIWFKEDSFVFFYQPFIGDGEIVLHAAAIEAVDPYTKVGVMFREALTPNSRYALTCLTPGNGFAFQERTQTGEESKSTKEEAPVPGWVKLSRSGSKLSSFVSTDGRTWKPLGAPVEMDLPPQIYVGIAATSHNVDTKAAMQVSHLQIIRKKRK